jgi:hypothetical protein
MKRIIGAMFCCALIAGSAAAQKRQAGSNQRQASLTIQVNIVPVAASPQPQPGGPHSEAVTYNIPVARLRLSVTEKIQEEWVKNSNGDAQLWVVKTITVVPE